MLTTIVISGYLASLLRANRGLGRLLGDPTVHYALEALVSLGDPMSTSNAKIPNKKPRTSHLPLFSRFRPATEAQNPAKTNAWTRIRINRTSINTLPSL
jgi:hypothetical protein